MSKRRKHSKLRFIVSLCLFVTVLVVGYRMYADLKAQGYMDDISSAWETYKNVDIKTVRDDYGKSIQQLEQMREDISSGEVISREEVDDMLDELGTDVDVTDFKGLLDKLFDYLEIIK